MTITILKERKRTSLRFKHRGICVGYLIEDSHVRYYINTANGDIVEITAIDTLNISDSPTPLRVLPPEIKTVFDDFVQSSHKIPTLYQVYPDFYDARFSMDKSYDVIKENWNYIWIRYDNTGEERMLGRCHFRWAEEPSTNLSRGWHWCLVDDGNRRTLRYYMKSRDIWWTSNSIDCSVCEAPMKVLIWNKPITQQNS